MARVVFLFLLLFALGSSVSLAQTSNHSHSEIYRSVPGPRCKITVAQEIRNGRYDLKSARSYQLINDQLTQDFLNELVARIRTVAPKYALYFPYRVYYFVSKDQDASSYAGGHIFISDGIVKGVGSEGGLIFWMGHEVAHAALMHVTEKLLAADNPHLTNRQIRRLLHYQELEADAVGVLVMMELGYASELAIQTMIDQHDKGGFTHPSSQYRARRLRSVISQYLKKNPDWKPKFHDPRKFFEVRARANENTETWAKLPTSDISKIAEKSQR